MKSRLHTIVYNDILYYRDRRADKTGRLRVSRGFCSPQLILLPGLKEFLQVSHSNANLFKQLELVS